MSVRHEVHILNWKVRKHIPGLDAEVLYTRSSRRLEGESGYFMETKVVRPQAASANRTLLRAGDIWTPLRLVGSRSDVARPQGLQQRAVHFVSAFVFICSSMTSKIHRLNPESSPAADCTCFRLGSLTPPSSLLL